MDGTLLVLYEKQCQKKNTALEYKFSSCRSNTQKRTATREYQLPSCMNVFLQHRIFIYMSQNCQRPQVLIFCTLCIIHSNMSEYLSQQINIFYLCHQYMLTSRVKATLCNHPLPARLVCLLPFPILGIKSALNLYSHGSIIFYQQTLFSQYTNFPWLQNLD